MAPIGRVGFDMKQIDRPQLQVSIDATIAEITLNENLSYGVQFFLKSKDVGAGTDKGSGLFSTSASQILGRTLPGFNFLIGPELEPRMIPIERLLERRDDDTGQSCLDRRSECTRRRRRMPGGSLRFAISPREAPRGIPEEDQRIEGFDETGKVHGSTFSTTCSTRFKTRSARQSQARRRGTGAVRRAV